MVNAPSISTPFTEQFESVRGSLPGQGLAWLSSRRNKSMAEYANTGMPTPKLESWKFTRLPRIASDDFRAAERRDGEISIDAVPSLFGPSSSGHRLVFVNGVYREDLSNIEQLPKGIRLEPLSVTLERDPAFVEKYLSDQTGVDGAALNALNSAFMDSGIVVHVEPGVVIEEPVEIVRLNGRTDTPIVRHPRNLIVLEDGAQLTLIKNHVGLDVGGYLTNAVTDIHIGNGAIFRHYTVQAETKDAIHLVSANVNVGQDATYEAFSLAIGGRLSRTQSNVRLAGRGSHCGLSGAYLMRGREHCDNTTIIEHLIPDATSREVFKGVLDDEARGVFQGKIVVHKDAQRTDGYQLSKALLLSDGAEMDAKPELEIYADDVKCSHGATTGQLDETSLFYLRSRGIPETLARNLLIQSFMGEALDEVSNEAVREAMRDRMIHWLPAHCYLSEEWVQE